ncbi:MAG: TAXI family TRAP transporter solute-binding subunit, partial [Alphaproteobacteria bacterium]|nr:TAXI family TRAP transporter solute-binding subunit [Alphaproteobacteria bacterium]
TWDAIEQELGRSGGQPVNMSELNAGEATTALCTGVIDADLLILGHPSQLVANRLAACPSNFVVITGPDIDKLIDTHSFYVRSSIPTEFYGTDAEVPTFGTLATLVTSASTDARVVAAMARTIITHVDELRRLHPTLAQLQPQHMVTQGLTAPLHPAAEAVYRELGLLK